MLPLLAETGRPRCSLASILGAEGPSTGRGFEHEKNGKRLLPLPHEFLYACILFERSLYMMRHTQMQ